MAGCLPRTGRLLRCCIAWRPAAAGRLPTTTYSCTSSRSSCCTGRVPACVPVVPRYAARPAAAESSRGSSSTAAAAGRAGGGRCGGAAVHQTPDAPLQQQQQQPAQACMRMRAAHDARMRCCIAASTAHLHMMACCIASCFMMHGTMQPCGMQPAAVQQCSGSRSLERQTASSPPSPTAPPCVASASASADDGVLGGHLSWAVAAADSGAREAGAARRLCTAGAAPPPRRSGEAEAGACEPSPWLSS